MYLVVSSFLFSFLAPPPTHIYTLSLHDALPISRGAARRHARCDPRRPDRLRRDGDGAGVLRRARRCVRPGGRSRDRKSTRLNSSHITISYAVFCLKKKKTKNTTRQPQPG